MEMENYIFPFFWQHGESEAVLRKYMQVIYDANIRAVCSSKAAHIRILWSWLVAGYGHYFEEARKRKMKVWILDDSHFPQDIVTEKLRKNRTPARDGS